MTKEKFRHYWVEDLEGNTYDISMELAKLNSPELMKVLAYTLSSDDKESGIEMDQTSEDLFKLYLEEPKKFWKAVGTLRSSP